MVLVRPDQLKTIQNVDLLRDFLLAAEQSIRGWPTAVEPTYPHHSTWSQRENQSDGHGNERATQARDEFMDSFFAEWSLSCPAVAAVDAEIVFKATHAHRLAAAFVIALKRCIADLYCDRAIADTSTERQLAHHVLSTFSRYCQCVQVKPEEVFNIAKLATTSHSPSSYPGRTTPRGGDVVDEPRNKKRRGEDLDNVSNAESAVEERRQEFVIVHVNGSDWFQCACGFRAPTRTKFERHWQSPRHSRARAAGLTAVGPAVVVLEPVVSGRRQMKITKVLPNSKAARFLETHSLSRVPPTTLMDVVRQGARGWIVKRSGSGTLRPEKVSDRCLLSWAYAVYSGKPPAFPDALHWCALSANRTDRGDEPNARPAASINSSPTPLLTLMAEMLPRSTMELIAKTSPVGIVVDGFRSGRSCDELLMLIADHRKVALSKKSARTAQRSMVVHTGMNAPGEGEDEDIDFDDCEIEIGSTVTATMATYLK